MPADLSRISVILVEPIYAGNVGAVARIMNNFCFTDLRIVGSVPQKNDFYLAMHSEHILDEAKIFPTLADAIADLDRVIAFSRRLGKTKPVDHSPMQMAAYVHSLPELKIGLVFGRETFGLTDIEADLCPLRCHFSANKDFPSINLAQATALALYEVQSFSQRQTELDGTRFPAAVNGEELTKIYRYIKEVLAGIGYFTNYETTNWDAFLQKMLAQLNPNQEMVYRLRQMFNRIHVLVTGKGKGYD
ncbi:MAG: TrmH family RNA methyltransferase [Candidatus Cloacimonadaceae bacterium]|jgi:tRNA/rRNA methyltransferase|nr:tRNA methyltransferase [Candidatus Cloacimonadota bacterium]MDY0318788.1 TrmH family RNA methyltransferase [Candidatus Cloacimonadaceae bacterium]HQB97280.1 TrmH family RNA methyltransferase [Candidatus Cloacimonadota bacterium]